MSEILFVGAEGRMEMEKVPSAGYNIVGLPVAGLQRRLTFKNLTLPFKLIKSIVKAAQIIRQFQPDAVVGVGGYASAPVLWQAQRMGIPTLIQEQNSYAGLTNRLLSKRAKCVCVAYPGMDRFFSEDKIVCTGNPVRQDLYELDGMRTVAADYFGVDADRPTVLVLGGSLGARTVNESIAGCLDVFEQNNIGLVWQTGRHYYETALELAANRRSVKVIDFISKMNYAYAVADVIVSRAGAGAISELCIAGKPSILIPSPNVSEDHQTKNAMSLVDRNAAIMIRDSEARGQLSAAVVDLLDNRPRMSGLSGNITALAMPDAAKEIVSRLLMIIKQYKVN
jgi:UDP-N-acetylglucosamine--N-acetylmuramyl-(pentapeptide) pyrophosphoryl-undecaprenol N-acetylglucosamine transferase